MVNYHKGETMAAVAGAAVILLCSLLCSTVPLTQSQKIVTRYSNSWAVEVTGGKDKADEIAERHGLINLGAVSMTMIFLLTLTIIFIIDWFIK